MLALICFMHSFQFILFWGWVSGMLALFFYLFLFPGFSHLQRYSFVRRIYGKKGGVVKGIGG